MAHRVSKDDRNDPRSQSATHALSYGLVQATSIDFAEVGVTLVAGRRIGLILKEASSSCSRLFSVEDRRFETLLLEVFPKHKQEGRGPILSHQGSLLEVGRLLKYTNL
ncbi:hypothetical protein J6590_087034 [Homalodisca vitripennis]|nr:hypothetical protein J6590_087034 [Homalodisca vitripennis]